MAETHVFAGLLGAVRSLDRQASDVDDLASVAGLTAGVASAHSAFGQDAVGTGAVLGSALREADGYVTCAVLVDPDTVGEVTLSAVGGPLA